MSVSPRYGLPWEANTRSTVPLLCLVLSLTLGARPAAAQTGGAYEISWSALTGGGGRSGLGDVGVDGTLGQLSASQASAGDYAVVGGFWAIVATPCLLDVDRDGSAQAATDVVYLARHLLGLTPVPPSFRLLDPGIAADAAIAAHITAAGSALDADADGTIAAATDVVYVARHLLGFGPVPPSFRLIDQDIPPDARITATIDAMCPGQSARGAPPR